MKFVYDETYDARGWFDPTLTADGWWDDEMSQDDEVVPPGVTGQEWLQAARRKHRR